MFGDFQGLSWDIPYKGYQSSQLACYKLKTLELAKRKNLEISIYKKTQWSS